MQYTFIDNALNPIWTKLTDMLPMWLAPNAVTTFGGLHCGLAYYVLWQLSPNFDDVVPDWALFLAGYCTIAYYTLDCMDGKQARRTGSSSPLGQLFDHGFDCICNMVRTAYSVQSLSMLESFTFLVFSIAIIRAIEFPIIWYLHCLHFH